LRLFFGHKTASLPLKANSDESIGPYRFACGAKPFKHLELPTTSKIRSRREEVFDYSSESGEPTTKTLTLAHIRSPV
jgi:hypothetical protein